MKSIFFISFLILGLNSAHSAVLPTCKDRNGNELSGSVDELNKVRTTNSNRPEVFVKGVVEKILPEDKAGNPHQKYMLNVSGYKIQVVSNLEFGRIPVSVGTSVQVCGEYLKVGSGMVHWTHFDPHGGHPDGFTVVNGKLYGDVETPL